MAGYGDDAGFADWLSGRGHVLPPTAQPAAVLRLLGSDYVDRTYAGRLLCSAPTGGFEQLRAWPRKGAKAHGQRIPEDLIPPKWVEASYRAAWLEASSPGWTSATLDPNKRVKRQKVEGLEREFFDNAEAGAGSAAAMARLDADIASAVAPFLCPEGDGGRLGLWAVGR